MAGDSISCPYHDKPLPQWCNECGGFLGWFCAICGESWHDGSDGPGWCCCVDGPSLIVDGPVPTEAMLAEIEARFETLGWIPYDREN